jgi:hypothetical protein
VIVRAGWSDRYPEALDLLDGARRAGLTFKVERWRWLIARARIASRTGDAAAAANLAAEALALLQDPALDFPRHPDVGLISADRGTIRELEAMIAGA